MTANPDGSVTRTLSVACATGLVEVRAWDYGDWAAHATLWTEQPIPADDPLVQAYTVTHLESGLRVFPNGTDLTWPHAVELARLLQRGRWVVTREKWDEIRPRLRSTLRAFLKRHGYAVPACPKDTRMSFQ